MPANLVLPKYLIRRLYQQMGWASIQVTRLTEALRLPSGGDTRHAGLVWHDNLLWVSYYASHEGKTSIYLAKVGLHP